MNSTASESKSFSAQAVYIIFLECPNIPYFEHKEIFSDQKSELFYFKANLPESSRRCSSDNKDFHWLGFQIQLDHLMANFEYKEVFC